MHNYYIDNPKLSEKFIEKYIIDNDKIVVFLGNGTQYKIQNTPENLKKVQEIMGRQVVQSHKELPKLKRKKIITYIVSLIQIFGAAAISVAAFQLIVLYGINLATILIFAGTLTTSGVIFQSGLQSSMKAWHIAFLEDDIKKNQIFVQIEDEIKDDMKYVNLDIEGLSKEKTEEAVESLSLNDIHDLTLEELKELRSSIYTRNWLKVILKDRASEVGEESLETETPKTMTLSPKKDNCKNK